MSIGEVMILGKNMDLPSAGNSALGKLNNDRILANNKYTAKYTHVPAISRSVCYI